MYASTSTSMGISVLFLTKSGESVHFENSPDHLFSISPEVSQLLAFCPLFSPFDQKPSLFDNEFSPDYSFPAE